MSEKLSTNLKPVEGGSVTSPLGFTAAGITAGFKKSGNPDMALLLSECPCAFAGTFTSNLFPAAPVQLCRDRVEHSPSVRAVVINSGVANACTGSEGMRHAEETAAITAKELGISPAEVLVCSTGRIGVQLPMDKISFGVHAAAQALSRDGGPTAARAIMTTDTKPKTLAVSFDWKGKRITVGGMTKGAGMIAPQMKPAFPHATMLCFITTDAEISKQDLIQFLIPAVEQSFNRITVDNDMSTNDTCLLFANGRSGVRITSDDGELAALFQAAINEVSGTLARKMVMDGEGSTKFVKVTVKGARSACDAYRCARSICDSMLCKTAWFGADPNWGRVLAAAGYSGAQFKPENVSLDYDGVPVVRGGMDAGTPEAELAELMKKAQFEIELDLGAGEFSDTLWTSDISYEYVKINADYHT